MILIAVVTCGLTSVVADLLGSPSFSKVAAVFGIAFILGGVTIIALEKRKARSQR
jgi:hypothetical protein